MTLNKQRIAIAELRGWTLIKVFKDKGGKPFIVGLPPTAAARREAHRSQGDPEIPPIDLNEMANARKVLSRDQQTAFIQRLENIVSRDGNKSTNLWSWAIVDSTAPQQSEAILLAAGKWNPTRKAKLHTLDTLR